MGSKYLKRSKTGWYSYRRRIPARLQKVIGKLEFKQRLETKDETTALIRLARANQLADAELRIADSQLSSSEQKLTRHEVMSAARQMLMREGFHPDQKPTLPADYTKEQKEQFYKDKQRWEALDEMFTGAYLSSQEIGVDPQTWDAQYKRDDPTDIMQAASRIVFGKESTSLELTWGEVVDAYLAINAREKRRDPHDQKKFETKTRNLYDKFRHFVGGSDTKLKAINRQDARAFLETYRQGPKPAKEGSIGRYASQIGAVFNFARKEYQDGTILNPFEGLRNMSAERDDATDRRSFTPSELIRFEVVVRAKIIPEIRLIGLLMIYTGCRTSEAAGLQVKDISLTSNTPHIKIRNNKFRKLEKGGLERSVPLVSPMLDALRSYQMPDNPEDGAFGAYAPRSALDNVSIQLNKLIRVEMQVSDPELVSYSTRHTFKARGRAARVSSEVLDYLQGHKTTQSSAVAMRYGTGAPPNVYKDDLDRLFAVTEWGLD
ncbi:DUF6538 domain-containing protein [Yoonia sediminilitoris]|nr:DUF6538 domain-containing protein [Yoonia sediminilitoris]